MKLFARGCAVVVLALSTISVSAGLKKIKDCSATQVEDIDKTAGWIADNWSSYEDFVENRTGLNIKNCMEKRFKKNGKVVCEEETGRCQASNHNNGWASPFNKKVHLCPFFLDNIHGFSPIDRRACYAALLSHEFAHSCDRTGHGSEKIDNAAFDFWKKNHGGVSITLDDCGMD